MGSFYQIIGPNCKVISFGKRILLGKNGVFLLELQSKSLLSCETPMVHQIGIGYMEHSSFFLTKFDQNLINCLVVLT